MTSKFKRIQSPSSILAYRRGDGFKWGCPRKYYLRYIKKLKTKPSLPLITGNMVHSTIEDFTKAYLPEMLKRDHDDLKKFALAFLQKHWRQRQPEILKLCDGNGKYVEAYNECQAMIFNWLSVFLMEMRAGRSPPAAETRLICDVNGVQGIIDATYNDTGNCEVRDYKTGRKNEITQDIKLQLAIYSLLHKQHFGKFPSKVSIHFLKYPPSKDNPKIFRPTRKLVDWAAQEIADHHERTRSDNEEDYPCVCGGWCEKDFLLC